MSSELTWLLLRKNNSFLVKRDRYTFSREPGNLVNKNSFKFSNLARENAIGVDFNRKKGEIAPGYVLSVKSKRAAIRTRPAKTFSKIVVATSNRSQQVKSIMSLKKQKYRSDLIHTALARWSKINKATTKGTACLAKANANAKKAADKKTAAEKRKAAKN